MTQDGHKETIQWYFVSEFAPIFGHHRFGSLNYLPDVANAGVIGEDRGAARPWRDGSRPPWQPDGTLPLGTPDEYIFGATSIRSSPWPVDWLGRRAAQTGLPPGLFPPMFGHDVAPPLVSSIHGPATLVASFPDVVQWDWPGRVPTLVVQWQDIFQPTVPMACFVGLPFMWASRGGMAFRLLHCVSYDPGTTVSVWNDPLGFILDFGETLTLTYGV